ncbi:GNAT family N-acetyltransferase [Pseudobacteriovorax antillogorgiicola]|uniref:N-acetyltransferase domain-containing protein n=1 Tax=Pseudobacteriovorax antillogorgiicola TaxID=1513793 RepID=A0A1Y6BCE6_9BACT|nr:GNAT family N-acetyltransferase [Pseudobacteriovorax antillogorgiicola]TCS58631.1 hypothetical protein EDD56_102144 [Pseudobacteriovorax antillogorgiicola]SME96607.1 hypothetical protein SAMN06296036_102299 [Pseudobacteriovorax antillogorgiicola]
MFEQMLKLRLGVLEEIPGFRNDASMTKILGDYFAAIYKYRQGEIAFLEKEGEWLAYVMASRFYHRFYGSVLTQFVLDFKPEFSDEAVPMIRNFIESYAKSEQFSLVELYAPCFALVEGLASNWRIAATSYGGDPALSLKEAKTLAKKDAFKDNDIELVTADDPEQVDRIMALKIEAFKENPELCWYWNCDQYQTQEFMRLMNSLDRQETFLLKKKSRIVGYGGINFDAHNAYWGPTSGVDLVLSPKLRGKGLSYPLYAHLFEAMIARGAKFYKGATHNPAVIKVASYFNRWPLYYQLLPKDLKI